METQGFPHAGRMAGLKYGVMTTPQLVMSSGVPSSTMFTTLYKSVPARSPQIDTYNQLYNNISPAIGGGTFKVNRSV